MASKQELLDLELKKDILLDAVSEGEEEEDGYSEGETRSNTESNGDGDSGTMQIAKKETRLLMGSKMLVFFVLLLATAGCAVGTYLFTREADELVFKTAVEDYAHEIHTISQLSAKQVFGSLNAMCVTMTSYARSVNATWPYVVVNDFQERGEQLQSLSGSTGLGLIPLVPKADFDKWTKFTNETNAGLDLEEFPPGTISPTIYATKYQDAEFYAPLWHRTPFRASSINRDVYRPERHATLLEKRTVTLASMNIESLNETNFDDEFTFPRVVMSAPVFDTFEPDSKLVAYFTFLILWHRLYENILPDGVKGMYVVVSAVGCRDVDTAVTYSLDGPTVAYLGPGDLHEEAYEDMQFAFKFDIFDNSCDFDIFIYPSKTMEDTYKTKKPIVYTTVVVLVFILTSMVFFIYDVLVERRQNTVMTSAQRSNAIVSSLFPAQFRDRLMEDAAQNASGDANKKKSGPQAFLKRDQHPSPFASAATAGVTFDGNSMLNSKPLADLFPFVTVMFGDISGFTAWSSVREPAQVFTLLEQIYSSFDSIAKRTRIFKVETIGDCYVAASGLPEPREDHAEVMARFATECRFTMNRVVQKLEVLLGPDTAELTMRFGLHSGPVTAGVLRGEKCRFQLFGDTVNTASRIESTGQSNMIHVSEDTANILMARGRSDWITPRDAVVSAKGKGFMQTYWLTMKRRHCASVKQEGVKHISDTVSDHSDVLSEHSGATAEDQDIRDQRTKRLVEWNVEVLHGQLKKIVAMRDPAANKVSNGSNLKFERVKGQTVLDEVLEVIPLSSKTKSYQRNPEMIILDKAVVSQLQDYVSTIASMYRDNHFHSFEHASHVTMSVTKLLARVVTPDSIDYKDFQYKQVPQGEAQLHEYTYGITSDPLIHFACALSALIHDVDHTGVPNSQLIKENAIIADVYRNQSVAEQNSVDLAWGLLMEPRYDVLRACICSNQEELDRFRHLVVNSVMATDIVDKELGALRKNRWNKAFQGISSDANSDIKESAKSQQQEDVNRKATIVIEHLIQASDVAHTMQHWHVYIKWNERFFHECYQAYLDGRAEKDPSESWYQGELGFFDFYIIPLAKKLKECNVFGVASDEYLNYAVANRQEWEAKGKEVVQHYLSNHKQQSQKEFVC